MMVEVRVPATSANLGPGFDAFGMAFQLYNTFSVKENPDGGLLITGVDQHYQNKSNLFYKAMFQVFRRVCHHPKGLSIHCDNRIPFSRGMGSSASCIAGGMIAANALSGNLLSQDTLLELAVKMEGHRDNITAAFYGGLVASVEEEGQPSLIKNTVSDCYAFLAVIPDFPVLTGNARNILPRKIPFEDGVYNVSHGVLTYLALTQSHPEILKTALRDRLHQPYRKKFIEDYDVLEEMAYAHHALGVCISGSGPTILVISDKNHVAALEKALKGWLSVSHPGWQILPLLPDQDGARLFLKEKGTENDTGLFDRS